MKNLKALIKKVEDSKENIKKLKTILIVGKTNKDYSSNGCFGFFTKGRNDVYATCWNDEIVKDAILFAIEAAEKEIAKDAQVVAAMELMISPEVKQAPAAAPAPPPAVPPQPVRM